MPNRMQSPTWLCRSTALRRLDGRLSTLSGSSRHKIERRKADIPPVSGESLFSTPAAGRFVESGHSKQQSMLILAIRPRARGRFAVHRSEERRAGGAVCLIE